MVAAARAVPVHEPAKKTLEQLERLCSEDAPCRLMITYTTESFILDPKLKEGKVKLQI